jgi:hypothetical protein
MSRNLHTSAHRMAADEFVHHRFQLNNIGGEEANA